MREVLGSSKPSPFAVMKPLFACILCLLACSAIAQEASQNTGQQGLRGTWMASAGSRSFRGRWWGELLPKTHDAASGSWTLLSDSNQIVLEGTWSARKSAEGWHGTWTARLNSRQAFSGTWTSDMSGKGTFEQMLKQAIEKEVAGSWRSGRMQGAWRLLGPG